MIGLGKILIIDDNDDVLFALKLLLKTHAECVKLMHSPERIVHAMTEFRPDIVLLDMNFTRDTVNGEEGMDCLQSILKLDPDAVVVMMTAYADTDKAVQAIKAGATDFVSKPWDNGKLLATLHSAMRLRRSQTDAARLQERVEALNAERENAGIQLIGESDGMKRITDTIARIGHTDVNVLLLGENGTGKDVLARHLLAHSARAAEPFVRIDEISRSPVLKMLDAGAAGQNLVLAAHAYGLGACWLTFTSEEMKQRIRDYVTLPEYMRMTTYVDMGYPDQSPYPPQRISVDEAVYYWK